MSEEEREPEIPSFLNRDQEEELWRKFLNSRTVQEINMEIAGREVSMEKKENGIWLIEQGIGYASWVDIAIFKQDPPTPEEIAYIFEKENIEAVQEDPVEFPDSEYKELSRWFETVRRLPKKPVKYLARGGTSLL